MLCWAQKKTRVEYERKRDLEIQKQRLIQRRELAVQGVKEEGQTGRVDKQIAGRADVAGKQIAGRADVAGKQIAGRADVAAQQIEGKAAEGQADREVKVDIAVLQSADAEARDKQDAELRREEMQNKIDLATAKRRSEALLRAAERARYQYQLGNLGESVEEDAEGLDDYLLEGSYNSEKPGMTTAGNSEQLMAELNEKLSNPATFERVTEKMRSDPDFKREILELVNSATTNIYNRTKSVSQNGQVRFNPIFHSPEQPDGVDKKGFGNIGKLPGVRERYWRMLVADPDFNSNATDEGTVGVRVNNNGTVIANQRPSSTTNINLITNPDIKAKLVANRVRDEDISPETAAEINAFTEDANMVTFALQTGASQNPANRRAAALNFKTVHLRGSLQDTEKVLEKSASVFNYLKSTAVQSKPVPQRSRSQNMVAMQTTGSATMPSSPLKKISEPAKKAMVLGRAKYLGAQNLARTLNKIRELENGGYSSQGAVNNFKAFMEGAFGSTGQMQQIISVFAGQRNLSGESLYAIEGSYGDVRSYMSLDGFGGVQAGMKKQLLRLAAYQMALTYQSASDKITDMDVTRFERMLNEAFVSGEQFNRQVSNFMEDANFQLMKNFGFANTTVEDDYSNIVAAQKMDAFAGDLGNDSARGLILGARNATTQPPAPARQPVFDGQQLAKLVYDEFAPPGKLQDFMLNFVKNVNSVVSKQMITGANAEQTNNEVGDNSEIKIVASQPIQGQKNAFLVKAKVKQKGSDQELEHLFKLRIQGTGKDFRTFIENITPEDVPPQPRAMGGVISSFAKSVAARK